MVSEMVRVRRSTKPSVSRLPLQAQGLGEASPSGNRVVRVGRLDVDRGVVAIEGTSVFPWSDNFIPAAGGDRDDPGVCVDELRHPDRRRRDREVEGGTARGRDRPVIGLWRLSIGKGANYGFARLPAKPSTSMSSRTDTRLDRRGPPSKLSVEFMIPRPGLPAASG